MNSNFDKNDPGRFLGEGVSFRAKLIGVLEVPEARGDRMCQEALADLKMAIRAAGEHKQRIQVHVAIDGLRLRDDKTGDSLYHHPVHKISFIAQDMSDSRAFGYIFGSPDTGHRFFGIKTDKAASQVVIAMRDLFQVVFELKKKEIEMAKQHLESKNSTGSTSGRHNASVTADLTKLKINTSEPSSSTSKPSESGAEGGVAELVDLEQELSSLRRGLTLVEGLTPSSDPFGDSFIIPSQTGLLPPPPAASSRGRSAARAASPGQTSNTPLSFDLASVQTEPPDNAESTSLVDNSESSVSQISCKPPNSLSYDVFTELDPLGTGRSKPYVDKKLFFQELKNPPKKVLKDLVPTTTTTNLLSDILPTFTTTVETMKGEQTTTITSLPRQSGGSVSIAKSSNYSNNYLFSSDPFEETDPFDSADPFSDTFKEDPFVSNLQEYPKPVFSEEFRSRMRDKSEGGKNMFNGCLQVSLPPEPTPKSPRLQRQTTDTSSIRQRPQPSSKLNSESTSPPPPLPPKKVIELSTNRPPPRPPYEQHEPHTDSGAESGPPIPRPARRREPVMADRSAKPRLSSGATNSSEDEYLSPIPPPLPGGRRFDITLSQLLTCGMDELAQRLRVPASNLSSMTLPQLTTYLRSYLAADSERANIHIEPVRVNEKEQVPVTPPVIPKTTPEYKPRPTTKTKSHRNNKIDFKSNFEDDFTPSNDTSDTFEANFDDFDKKANPSYDRYAAFREIQELELTNKSIPNPLQDDDQQQNGDCDNREDSDEKEESPVSNVDIKETKELEKERDSHSPLKSLDELTLDSFNMFRNSVSPKPTQMEAKIEDIKTVMKNLQLEQARRSVSPRDVGSGNLEHSKLEETASDRYAALRDIITITEPQDEFESLPPEITKERKRSDEKSDGFDNSDFFDCIDNSSLSFSHVDDAFRKSPLVREEDTFRKSPLVREEDTFRKSPLVREEDTFRKSPLVKEEDTFRKSPLVREQDTFRKVPIVREEDTFRKGPLVREEDTFRKGPLVREDDTFRKGPLVREEDTFRKGPLLREKLEIELKKKEEKKDLTPQVECLRELQPPARLSTGSMSELASGSSPETKERRSGGRWSVLCAPGSSDSKDSEPAPPRPRRNHHRCRERHTSSSSRDASPWEEEPPPARLHRGHSHHRDSRHNSSGSRDCLDSGSGKDKMRDKRDIRERDRDSRDSGSTRERRDSGSGRDRDIRPRDISKDRDPRDRRDRRSRDRDKDWDRDRDYSRERDYRDSRSRERLSKDYRDIDRERHRKTSHHSWDDDEEYSDGCGSGRSSPRERWSDYRWRRDERNYGSLGWRETRRRSELRQSEDNSDRRYGATLSWSGRRGCASGRAHERRRRHERRHARDHDAHKRPPYSELEATRFAFELDDSTASPLSIGSRPRDPESPATRFRFDSDSISPRSMFEDDFTAVATPRTRAASIAEEEENDLPPLRAKQQTHRDIKKSESVNIFVRESDPFEGDDFFACTGSDRAARRDNWPGRFQAFDNV